jgi:preprotein translocase subunit SecG
MEFPMKVLVIAILAIIAFLILLILLQVLSGGSFDIFAGLMEWFRGMMP